MADSSAVRTRRARRHKAGDHSLCSPGRCPALEQPSELPRTHPSDEAGTTNLGIRGQALWDAITAAWTPAPLHRELLVEACRLADRLDQLDSQLRGHGWLRFRRSEDDPETVFMVVDRALSEAREQQNTLKALVLELAKAIPEAEPEKKGGVLYDLAAELKGRRGTAG